LRVLILSLTFAIIDSRKNTLERKRIVKKSRELSASDFIVT